MDINLTGQIAATLAENLKQPWYNPIISFSAGVIGGFVTGIITLLAVKITNDSAGKRDERNHKEEARRIRREERKKAYIQFFSFTTTMDTFVKYPDFLSISLDELFIQLNLNIAEITLLSPEIADHIGGIILKYPNLGEKFQEIWKDFSNEIRADVFPLMQAELNNSSAEES